MQGITALTWVTTAIAVYHIIIVAQLPTWLGWFLPNQIHLAISLICALTLIFIRKRGGHGTSKTIVTTGGLTVFGVAWYNYVLIASTLLGAGYVVLFYDAILDYGMYGFLDERGMVVALALAIPLLEAIRRTTGWALPIIILMFVFMTLFQRFLPGLLYGKGYPLDRLLYSTYIGEGGIFGLPLNVAANIVIVFLIFGAMMHAAGAGRWFIDIALALTGWSRGGPAKAAVLSSALFGSISGSPSANAATTGVFTIPMMKAIGYRPAFAGAVEAVASTGGQILPPVMGAIAFVMAEWIGVSYGQVVVAAAVPALLYFIIIFVSVHLQAHKDGVTALSRSELPSLGPVLSHGWYYLIPIAALIYFLLVETYPPGMAAMYALPFILGVSFLSKNREHWLTPKKLMIAFEDGVTRWVVVAAITGSVGIMIGALELSGVGIKLSNFIVDLAGGNLYLTLFFVGFASLVVGMGLDAIPAYITLATLMAPALVKLGVSDMAAHLFVVYWGLASFFTPPMCIVVYVTIGISGSRVWETGWEAVRLGIASFLIPFAFVLNEGLLLEGGLQRIAMATTTGTIGAILVACGIRGYALGHLNGVQRLLIFIGGLLFIAPGIYLALAGLAFTFAALALQRVGMRLMSRDSKRVAT
ncbi:MAG TPA: TRAP transporter fused permease subunit [Candidatus Binatia bacterium]|nr:TRAP transporter fused permease subunit [Candidatus Binatia bacterium]